MCSYSHLRWPESSEERGGRSRSGQLECGDSRARAGAWEWWSVQSVWSVHVFMTSPKVSPVTVGHNPVLLLHIVWILIQVLSTGSHWKQEAEKVKREHGAQSPGCGNKLCVLPSKDGGLRFYLLEEKTLVIITTFWEYEKLFCFVF